MSAKSVFFRCSIPSLTVHVYADNEQEAIAELEKRLRKAAPTLSDPSFDISKPGTGSVYIGYDSTAITVEEEVRAKLFIAFKANGETLPPIFVRHNPLSGDPIGENDSECNVFQPTVSGSLCFNPKNEKAAWQRGRPSLPRENSSNGGLPSKLSGEILWGYKGGVKEFL